MGVAIRILGQGESGDAGDVADIASSQQIVQYLVLAAQHTAGLQVDQQFSAGHLLRL